MLHCRTLTAVPAVVPLAKQWLRTRSTGQGDVGFAFLIKGEHHLTGQSNYFSFICTAAYSKKGDRKTMTIDELATLLGGKGFCRGKKDRAVTKATVGDLLSFIMGTAEEGAVWVTINPILMWRQSLF